MKTKLKEIIRKEDKKNPFTDAELSKMMNMRREHVTILRHELNIADSRERRKPLLLKEVGEVLAKNKDISERDLTRMIKDKGFSVSRHLIREYKKEIEMANTTAEKTRKTATETTKIQMQDTKSNAFDNIIGAEGSLKPYIQQAKAAMLYPPHGLHTLILGATGVGKSELALSMYEFAKETKMIKSNVPFIVFNCADYADNPQLLMAQLFGYVKGAFTGADNDKEGLVEKADGGLIFLDEVHRLPPEGQELLFYLIDKGRFRRLGETDTERQVRVTIIAATTENPDSMLLATFRRRIPMIIELPPLSIRPLKERFNIIKDFIRKEAYRTQNIIKVNNEPLRALLLYDCPGNIGQLRSDIQVSCARSFLNKVVNQTEMMEVTMDELPISAKKGLLKIKNNRIETEQLTGTSDIIIYPNDKPVKILPNEDLYTLPNEIYQYIEERYNDLQNQDMSHEVINYIIGSEMEERLEKLIRKVEGNTKPLEKKDLIKIVGIEVVNVVEKIIRIANWKLHITADNLYYILAVHLSTTIERIRQGKAIKNPQLDKIKKEYSKEFQVAKEMVAVIQKEFNIPISEDEAGFITMYLRMMTKEKEIVEEGRVGVIIISHGNVAEGMADVANRLLGVVHARALEMPLDESPEVTLERAIELTKSVDEGKGVLLLVDMGSLVTFGELITKKTGIRTRSLSRVDTVMVIEAVRRSILPDANLDEIIDTLEETPKYIGRLMQVDKKAKGKSKIVVTICITGQGSAERVKELIENLTHDLDEPVNIIPMGALDANFDQVIVDLQKNNEVMAIVGTIDPKISDIPYISLEEIVKGEGVKRFKNILSNRCSYFDKEDEKKQLKDLIDPAIVKLQLMGNNKEDIISQLAQLLIQNRYVDKGFMESVLEREKMGSTYIGQGVALPHGDQALVNRPAIAIATLKEEVNWSGSKTRLVMLAALSVDCIDVIKEIHGIIEDEGLIKELVEKNCFKEFKITLENRARRNK